ncbi:MAG: hypothetical protein JSR58_04795 [Verrucomicrobia bacterium]|nr:hypothetical protein [Verrucomicrobiota bacterium]
MGHRLYLYSPFSPHNIAKGRNPILLLQFILEDLLKLKNGHKKMHEVFLPYDFSIAPSPRYKVCEHAELLTLAFPELKAESQQFMNSLHLSRRRLVLLLEPFVRTCIGDENLLYFLLQRKKFPEIAELLSLTSPSGGSKALWKIVKDRYAERKFTLCHQYAI